MEGVRLGWPKHSGASLRVENKAEQAKERESGEKKKIPLFFSFFFFKNFQSNFQIHFEFSFVFLNKPLNTEYYAVACMHKHVARP
jgi:hypothetical protein